MAKWLTREKPSSSSSLGLRRIAHALALTEGHQLEASTFGIQPLSRWRARRCLLPAGERGPSPAPKRVARAEPGTCCRAGTDTSPGGTIPSPVEGLLLWWHHSTNPTTAGTTQSPLGDTGRASSSGCLTVGRSLQPSSSHRTALLPAWMDAVAGSAALPTAKTSRILPALWVPAWALSRAQANCGEGRAEKRSPPSVPADSGSRKTQRLLTAPCYTPHRGPSVQARALSLSLHMPTPSGIHSASPSEA